MLDTFYSLPTRRARIDFARTFAELDGLFYSRGLTAAPIPPELAVSRGRLGISIASKAFESERAARIVVTHVTAPPVFASLSVVGHPKKELDAPVLLADVRVLPSGVTRAFFDACGVTAGEFDALFRKPLSQTLDAAVASAVRRKRVPEWIDHVSSGAGAQLAASPGRGHVIVYALVRYVERWLDGIERAPAARDPSANAHASQLACDTVRANGRAGKMLARAFGEDFAGRWAQFVWNA
ncbi:MAG TPA: hypothetical protein VGH28_11885 [Polyangiaceae bacterium]|jgi:hypothetical protein